MLSVTTLYADFLTMLRTRPKSVEVPRI
jgi:hypothetical protein